jgi:hypothetical protein
MGVTSDPSDPRLTHGPDEKPRPQAEAYLVLSKEELDKGFIRPVRLTYIHEACGGVTSMSQTIAETYARNPKFYGGTYCAHCQKHLPVGPDGEFVWDDFSGEKVGT